MIAHTSPSPSSIHSYRVVSSVRIGITAIIILEITERSKKTEVFLPVIETPGSISYTPTGDIFSVIFSTQLLILENVFIFFSGTIEVLEETRADEATNGDCLATGLDEDGVKFDKGLGGRGGGLLPGFMIDEEEVDDDF